MLRNTAWFDLGARAAKQVFDPPFPEGAYICPLCHRAFSRQQLAKDELTREHAPADALGGRHIALTCRSCNSWAGHELDWHAVNYDKQFDFATGTLDEAVDARFIVDVDGAFLNSEITAIDDSILIRGLPLGQNNPPDAVERIEQVFRDLIESGTLIGSTFRLTFRPRFNPKRARIAWLRWAYLVAFAYWGYRYVYDPRLNPVRVQLAHPEQDILPVSKAILRDVDRRGRRLLLINAGPIPRSVMVQMGRHAVFLPRLDEPDNLYARLDEEMRQSDFENLSVSASELPWPARPLHTLDLGAQHLGAGESSR